MFIKEFFTSKSKKSEAIRTYLDYIINNLPHFLFWKDQNGVFLGCNKEFSKSAGFGSPEDVIGKTDYDMPWRESAADYVADDKYILKVGEPKLNYEEYQQQADGTSKVMLVSKVPMFDGQHEKIIGILGIYTDISERKQMEESLKQAKETAEAANLVKTEFLENMRHDIRTPLSGIVGAAQLLKNEKDKNKIQKYADHIDESSKEFLRFLNEILESLNVATGEIPLLKKKFSLKAVLENVVKLHQAKADEKKLELKLNVSENIPNYLIGDPVRIYRVILELLGNALKFTTEGYVHISTHLEKQQESELVIKIEVEDTGPGISVEEQQELFVRFKRLMPSYEGIYKGMGLGLSIAKQFIDDLQGELYYDGDYQKGAKFICLISLKKSLLENDLGEGKYTLMSTISSPKFPQEQSTASDETELQNEKNPILIVEDQPMTAYIVKELFEKLGCKVNIAEDGQTAIKLTKQNHYDLILMDIGLPDLDGYEVTKHIRTNAEPAQDRIPIIGLTAHLDDKKKQQGLNAGMNIVLTKPLLEETAVDILHKFISVFSKT